MAATKKHPANMNQEMLWTILELDWFSKTSYNLAIKYISIWSPQHLLRILNCCIAFINLYPGNVPAQISEDLSLRKMFCEFSAATALIGLARGQDDKKLSLQDYVNLRKHVKSYDQLLQEKLPTILPDDGPAKDLLCKLAVLIAFDFEAACHLKSWDQLGEIIMRSEICASPQMYELMADCILSIEGLSADRLSPYPEFLSTTNNNDSARNDIEEDTQSSLGA